ncbi:MAG: hypothetical protein H9789_12415, partial [Candidatus Paraprevotella stercoravium]|nr:hypothetical protein [Candidatus Paraprevotella stercoravium]
CNGVLWVSMCLAYDIDPPFPEPARRYLRKLHWGGREFRHRSHLTLSDPISMSCAHSYPNVLMQPTSTP